MHQTVKCVQEAGRTQPAEPDSVPRHHCHGCLTDLSAPDKEEQEPGVVLKCSGCKHLFCFDCDLYIHESLHNCPGCEASTVRHDSDEEDEHTVMAADQATLCM